MMKQYLFNTETVCTYIYINYHSGIYTIWPFSLKLYMYRYAMEWLQHDLSVSISLNTNQIPMQERLTIYTCQVPTDETSIQTTLLSTQQNSLSTKTFLIELNCGLCSYIYISVLLHHSLQIALYKNQKIKYGKLSLKLPILFPIEKYQEILSLQARVWAISPRNPQRSICIGMGIHLNHTCIYSHQFRSPQNLSLYLLSTNSCLSSVQTFNRQC